MHSIYELDNAPDTLHLGAFIEGTLAAIATICFQSMPNSSDSGEWRLRGMATRDEFRRRGLGKRLTEECVAYAQSKRGSFVWCSARMSAVSFYDSLGFRAVAGEPFSLPEYSPESYIVMRLCLSTAG
jgi:ribosomal protein S18 acetylase RimI-like enzyme